MCGWVGESGREEEGKVGLVRWRIQNGEGVGDGDGEMVLGLKRVYVQSNQ